jgi:hypothetical protein
VKQPATERLDVVKGDAALGKQDIRRSARATISRLPVARRPTARPLGSSLHRHAAEQVPDLPAGLMRLRVVKGGRQ